MQQSKNHLKNKARDRQQIRQNKEPDHVLGRDARHKLIAQMKEAPAYQVHENALKDELKAQNDAWVNREDIKAEAERTEQELLKLAAENEEFYTKQRRDLLEIIYEDKSKNVVREISPNARAQQLAKQRANQQQRVNQQLGDQQHDDQQHFDHQLPGKPANFHHGDSPGNFKGVQNENSIDANLVPEAWTPDKGDAVRISYNLKDRNGSLDLSNLEDSNNAEQ